MSASEAASAAVTGVAEALAGGGADTVGVGSRAPPSGTLPAQLSVRSGRIRVQYELRRDGGALGDRAGHDGRGQRGQQDFALADHRGRMFGAFGLAGDRTQECRSPQGGRLHRDAQ